jgi:hypothetical protein
MSTAYSIETLPEGWETARVNFHYQDGIPKSRIEIIDFKTNTRYRHESMCTIAFKCVLIALFLPSYTIANMTFHLVRTISLSLFNLLEAPQIFLRGSYDILKAPCFALAMECAAIFGICYPIQGRVYVGTIERAWKEGSDPKHDILHLKNKDRQLEMLKKLLTDPRSEGTHYLVHCFQPVGGQFDSKELLSPNI